MSPSLKLLLIGSEAAQSHCPSHSEILSVVPSRPPSLPLLSLKQQVIKPCSLHSSHGAIPELECLSGKGL